MTELLTNIAQLASIVQYIAFVVLAISIVVWAPIIWGALRGASKQDKTIRSQDKTIRSQDKTIRSYLDKITYLNDRLENETTIVYLDNPDGTTYVGPLNAKLALEALQSAQDAELDLRIRFADDPTTLEQYITDHQED